MAAKAKQKAAEEPKSDLIQIMTVSLFIILLAFFILLNAFATIDDIRQREVLGSIMKSFGILSGGSSLIEGQGDTIVPPKLQHSPEDIDLSHLYKLDDNLLVNIDMFANNNGNVVRIPADLLFQGHTARLKTAAEPLLIELGRTIASNQYPVEISGHSDNAYRISGKKISKRELTSMRAYQVLGYLIARTDIAPKRLTAFGWGAQQPIVSNQTPETRALNNRIEILFVNQKRVRKPKGVFTFKDFFFKVFE